MRMVSLNDDKVDNKCKVNDEFLNIQHLSQRDSEVQNASHNNDNEPSNLEKLLVIS